MTNVWVHPKDIDKDVAAIFDPFGNAVHTALSFPVLGEDVLVTGAGPIGIMAAAVAVHAAARYVVITDVNPYRLELARKMGVTRAVNPQETSLEGRAEGAGDDGGLRRGPGDVGQRAGLPRHARQHGPRRARSPCSASPIKEMAIDWNTVIFSMLTIKGIYGREMYETWYKMNVMLESGLDIKPVITHHFPCARVPEGLRGHDDGQLRPRGPGLASELIPPVMRP